LKALVSSYGTPVIEMPGVTIRQYPFPPPIQVLKGTLICSYFLAQQQGLDLELYPASMFENPGMLHRD